MKSKLLLLLAVLLIGLSCSNESNLRFKKAAEKEAIKLVLKKYIIANEAHNLSMIEELWARDSAVLSLGTDRHDVLNGFDAVRAKFEDQFNKFENTYISSRDQEIYVNPSCNSAWFSEVLQYNYTHGDKAIEYPDLRFTGYLEKRDGKWVFLQTHLSAPAD